MWKTRKGGFRSRGYDEQGFGWDSGGRRASAVWSTVWSSLPPAACGGKAVG
ncbi:hypothetical protein [Paenibacillus sp. FSL E2-0178]|uniref:hypothetical protein n=1 Tax=Paenibacillus sp. FSL E2-0178 TaxID=2921361 RepID=UPI0031596E52